MQTKFPWYVIHKDTKHIIAGFNDYNDAILFVNSFSHNMYVVRDCATMEAISN